MSDDMVAEHSTVLFVCIHDTGRSEIAAAWFNTLADKARAQAISARAQLDEHPQPEVLAAMREVGLDLLDARPHHLGDDLAQQATLLVTIGDGELRPRFEGLRRVNWLLEDPRGKPLVCVREIRAELKALVVNLIWAEGWQ